MIRRILILAGAIVSFCVIAIAQPPPGNGGIRYVASDPSGNCALAPPLLFNYTNAKLWGCENGTWTLVSGGGSSTPTEWTACASGCSATIGASPFTVTAATHGQGVYAKLECLTSATPESGSSCGFTRAANGDMVISYTTTPGLIGIYSPSVGATGPTGPTGPSGAGNNSFCADATGSGTTYTCPAAVPTPTTYTGLLITFIPQTTNSGAATVDVNSLGAKSLKAADCSTALATSALTGGSAYLFSYNGTVFCQSAGSGSLGISTSSGTTTGPSLPGTAPAGVVGVNIPYSQFERRNVKAYGAVGDGVADDGPSLLAASAAGGIYLPCGSYLMNTQKISLASTSTTVEGESAAAGGCVNIIQASSTIPAITYQSALAGSAYNQNNTVVIRNVHIYTNGNGIAINNTTIPTPSSYQANLVKLLIDNVYIQGPGTITGDANIYTPTLPTLSGLQAFGTGISCGQCFGLDIRGSIIQNFGLGVYYLGDEMLVSSNRITLNGNNIWIAPAIGGATTFASGNAIVIDSNVIGANYRAGAIRIESSTVGSIKITKNEYENYCKSSTFVVSHNSAGLDISQTTSYNPNNSTLAAANGCTYSGGGNATPLLVLDDVADDKIHDNYMGPNGNSVPSVSLLATNGNNSQYFIFNNDATWPNPYGTVANIVPYGQVQPFAPTVASNVLTIGVSNPPGFNGLLPIGGPMITTAVCTITVSGTPNGTMREYVSGGTGGTVLGTHTFNHNITASGVGCTAQSGTTLPDDAFWIRDWSVVSGVITPLPLHDYTTGNWSWQPLIAGSNVTITNVNGSKTVSATSPANITTGSNCSSSASPAVCVAASAGSVAFPTGVTSVPLTVNTTAVTANSQIFMFPDDTLGTKLSVTCNSTLATLVGGMAITARTPGTSFTVTFNGTIAGSPLCASFLIIN